jgi:POT family proton-dependent oligopeptide transporter
MTRPSRFPPQIKYIVGNEACERFSLYGMSAILMVYMTGHLAMDPQAAKLEYHAISQVSGPAALLGAWLADRYLGKFATVVLFSLLCCAGHLLLAVRGGDANGFLLGMGVVLFATGAMKPNISSHAGDQFEPDQKEELRRLFSIFYFAINFGAFFSTLLTPWLLVEYGPDIAFGLPGVLMLLATLVFIAGRRLYRKVPPAGGGDLFKVISLVGTAVLHWRKRPRGAGFLDGALRRYTPEQIEGVRSLGGVFKVFVPVSIYWALFGQMASSWTLQAAAMDLQVGGLTLLPAQIRSLNPILVMILIPLFSVWIFPWFEGRGVSLNPVRRMGWGMLLAAASFVLVGLIQISLDAGHRPSVLWQLLPYLVLTASEILVSVTGLEFAYSLAPVSMKSTVMSLWSLTGMTGNLIATLVIGFNRNGPLFEFLVYAALMVAAAILLRWMFSERKSPA